MPGRITSNPGDTISGVNTTKAIPLLQKALSLDPEFIMASRALGAAYMNIYDFAGQQKYDCLTLELIQKHPERVSERDRLWILTELLLLAKTGAGMGEVA